MDNFSKTDNYIYSIHGPYSGDPEHHIIASITILVFLLLIGSFTQISYESLAFLLTAIGSPYVYPQSTLPEQEEIYALFDYRE